MDGGEVVGMVLFLVIGLVLVTFIYYRSKEKQMMIERGMSYEQMMEFMRSKRDPYMLLKLGIVTLFFGVGLGAGLLINEATGVEEWIPFLIISMTGLGMIAAYYFAKRVEVADRKLNQNNLPL